MGKKLENLFEWSGWNAISAISAIIIAALGFTINHRLQQDSEKAERYRFLIEFRHEIFRFSEEFLDVTAVAIAEAEKDSGRNEESVALAANRLSAIVDKGRFIFPNYNDDTGFGNEKGPAFAGIRREPLDAILAAYFAVKSLEGDSEHYRELSHRELLRARQEISVDFDPNNTRSLIIEARRSYLNSVIPSTFPREWRSQFSELFGAVALTTEIELDEKLHSNAEKID